MKLSKISVFSVLDKTVVFLHFCPPASWSFELLFQVSIVKKEYICFQVKPPTAKDPCNDSVQSLVRPADASIPLRLQPRCVFMCGSYAWTHWIDSSPVTFNMKICEKFKKFSSPTSSWIWSRRKAHPAGRRSWKCLEACKNIFLCMSKLTGSSFMSIGSSIITFRRSLGSSADHFGYDEQSATRRSNRPSARPSAVNAKMKSDKIRFFAYSSLFPCNIILRKCPLGHSFRNAVCLCYFAIGCYCQR